MSNDDIKKKFREYTEVTPIEAEPITTPLSKATQDVADKTTEVAKTTQELAEQTQSLADMYTKQMTQAVESNQSITESLYGSPSVGKTKPQGAETNTTGADPTQLAMASAVGQEAGAAAGMYVGGPAGAALGRQVGAEVGKTMGQQSRGLSPMPNSSANPSSALNTSGLPTPRPGSGRGTAVPQPGDTPDGPQRKLR